jgi:hypothetical protein
MLDPALSAWTRGLPPVEARISVFTHVRDIPYALSERKRDPEKAETEMLRVKKGSCSPKHFLLGGLFGAMGLDVKYATYPFRWADLAIKYPEKLLELAGRMPMEYHLACKVRIGPRWVLVDATWDSALAKAGFPVNTRWDGLSDTLNAVDALGEIMHDTPRERALYVAEKRKVMSPEEKKATVLFIRELNSWLENIQK